MRRAAGPALFILLSPCFLSAETVLILPFFNVSQSKNIEWIGDSIAETLRESFAANGFLTASRSQRERAFEEAGIRRGVRLTRATVMDLAVNVDASLVIYGSFEAKPRAGGPDGAGVVSLRAEALDVRRLRRGPVEEQAGPVEDLSLLQNRLAWRLLKAIRPGLEATEEQFLEAHPPIRLDALESYVRGLLAPALDQRLALFANAARLAPAFSQPCFQLGRLHFERKDHRAAADWLERVTAADSNHREALFLSGVSRYHLGDFAAASEAFRRVAALAPTGAVLNNLGVAQFRAADSGAAASLRQALENDEADPDFHFNLAYVLWRRGEFEAAAASLRAVLERTPGDETAALLLARCEQGSGPRPGEPRFENLERLKTVFDDSALRHLQAILGQGPK